MMKSHRPDSNQAQIAYFSDEMGWLPSLEGMSGDPANTIAAEHRDVFYLANHKLAIHKKALAGLLHASTTFLLPLQPLLGTLDDSFASLSTDQIMELSNCTKILTLINPHHYTAWNIRKRLKGFLMSPRSIYSCIDLEKRGGHSEEQFWPIS